MEIRDLETEITQMIEDESIKPCSKGDWPGRSEWKYIYHERRSWLVSRSPLREDQTAVIYYWVDTGKIDNIEITSKKGIQRVYSIQTE